MIEGPRPAVAIMLRVRQSGRFSASLTIGLRGALWRLVVLTFRSPMMLLSFEVAATCFQESLCAERQTMFPDELHPCQRRASVGARPRWLTLLIIRTFSPAKTLHCLLLSSTSTLDVISLSQGGSLSTCGRVQHDRSRIIFFLFVGNCLIFPSVALFFECAIAKVASLLLKSKKFGHISNSITEISNTQHCHYSQKDTNSVANQEYNVSDKLAEGPTCEMRFIRIAAAVLLHLSLYKRIL